MLITTAELGCYERSLPVFGTRSATCDPQISDGLNETMRKKDGLIREDVSAPGDWSEVVLQGPHFFVATPFAKQPPHMGSKAKLWT